MSNLMAKSGFPLASSKATSNLNGNKAAGRRARKATLELTKLYKEYRNATIEAEKA